MTIQRTVSLRAVGIVTAAALFFLAVVFSSRTSAPRTSLVHAQSSPGYCTDNMTASLNSTLPTNFGNGQQGADCMAWQEFVSLNWRADPNHPGQPDTKATPDSFGTVDDPAPKVWETYMDSATIFATPAQYKALTAQPNIKRLSAISKFADADLNLNNNTQQAGSGKWLTSQSGNLTYYEVRLNNDEAAYIQTNSLTTFDGQKACATQPGQNVSGQGLVGGFNLPSGIGNLKLRPNTDYNCAGAKQGGYGTNSGAIEVKAAWVVLPDNSLNYRYKTSKAQITDPYGHTSTVTVGLVGMHIIHKVPTGQQFIWATFEQVDNSPDENGGSYSAPTLPLPHPHLIPLPVGTYTYFNPNCQNDKYYNCVHNQIPGDACAISHRSICDPYTAPMQVTRLNPVDRLANSATGYAWSLLPPKSVYNYYRLINAMWPSSNTPISPGAKTPLPLGNIQPSGQVANTTLETYEQGGTTNCLSCHIKTPIANSSTQSKVLVAGRPHREVKLDTTSSELGSDYSFVFAVNTTH